MSPTLDQVALEACLTSEWLRACLAAMDSGREVCLFPGYGT